MKLLSSLRVGPRLALAFGVLTVATVCVILFSISRLAALTDDLSLIGEDRVPKVQALEKLTDNVNLAARELRNALIWHDNAKVAAALDIAEKARDENSAILAKLSESIVSDEGKKRVENLKSARAAYGPAQKDFVDLVRGGKKAEAEVLLENRMRPAQLEYFKAVGALKDYQVGLITKAVEHGEDSYRTSRMVLFGVLAAMVVGSALFAWAISRSIVGPLEGAARSAGRIAEGDLTEPLVATGRDETAELLRAIERMQHALRDVVGRVRAGVDSVTTASAQIAAGNQDLSSRTEQQASSLQQTASSMEQINGTVTQSADNARQANQLASSASDAAGKGDAVMAQVVQTMEQISASSKKIADIIGTIDGIAFQTNILALNAAVEAARAGEQGRGFAVVASEVRALAQRSAQAAREIKALIAASVDSVEAGGKLVGEAGASMQDIRAQVKRVTDLVGEISSAAVEQSSGIGQINQAVAQMDQTTQQNAALVEESAAASASLSQQAQGLAQVVAVFKLDATTAPTPASAAQIPTLPVSSAMPASKPVTTPAKAARPATVTAKSTTTAAWNGSERRGPDRATNVSRLSSAKAPEASAAAPMAAMATIAPATSTVDSKAKTGTDDDWTTF